MSDYWTKNLENHKQMPSTLKKEHFTRLICKFKSHFSKSKIKEDKVGVGTNYLDSGRDIQLQYSGISAHLIESALAPSI